MSILGDSASLGVFRDWTEQGIKLWALTGVALGLVIGWLLHRAWSKK